VAGFARAEDRLRTLANTLPGALTLPGDARLPGTADEVVKQTLAAFGRLDGYVHAVGSILLKAAHLTRPEEFQEVLATNLTSAFLGLRAVLGPMQAAGSGRIVLVSTVAARVGLPNHEAIAAAKGGLEALGRSAAATYAPRGIRINVVAPGLVDTPLAAPILSNETNRQLSERMHPLGRVGRAEEVAGLIWWLLGEDAGWVTGQVWSIDGGMADVRPRPKA
jgi:Dehydrogenases with different specificities (related to short-chain alcohol dehydrogenases)